MKTTWIIGVNMDGSVFDGKSSFKVVGLSFSSKLSWGSDIVSFALGVLKKVRDLIYSMIYCIEFLSTKLALYLYISTIRSYVEYYFHIWFELLTESWICWISYRNRYLGLFVSHLLFLFSSWFIVEILQVSVFLYRFYLEDVLLNWFFVFAS